MTYRIPMSKIMQDVNIVMTENDLLQKCDVDNFKNFTGAMMLIFDLDPEILYNLSQMDYLWRPTTDKGYTANYIQWLTFSDCEERDPIEEIFSYLYRNGDAHWNEPYCFSERDIELRKQHLEKIELKYGGLDSYLKIVSNKLWQDSYYLRDNYLQIINSGRKQNKLSAY